MSELIEQLIALEADVRYQEPPTEDEPEFDYTQGKVPILLSAPHGAKHARIDQKTGKRKPKEEDEFTAGLARLVAEKSNAHVLWLRRRSDQDPNNDLESRYKQFLCKILRQQGIRFVLDVHGANSECGFGIALGTSKGKSCKREIQNLIVDTLGEHGFDANEGLEQLAINLRKYSATGEGTITRYVSKQLKVPAAQFEINAHLRIPRRRPDASSKEDFRSQDPALIEKTIETLIELVQVLTETMSARLDELELNRLVTLYNLESYLFEVVSRRFREDQTLSPYDFFPIVIWKSNRAKTKIKRGLIDAGKTVEELMREVSQAETAQAKVVALTEVWGIGLAIASAILAVCYQEEFTVLDYRTWETLEQEKVEGLPKGFPMSPEEYIQYCQACRRFAEQMGLSLRDLDRALWAKNWEDDLLVLIDCQ
jgi:hypothetical protein